jgi:disulfide bond formation protein DsbB
MYPLVLIFLVGLIKLDTAVFRYSIPLIGAGWFISVYHNLLHYEIIPESASPCREGLSCSDVWINWLGFITIPVLSFTAFSIMLILTIIFYKKFISKKDL